MEMETLIKHQIGKKVSMLAHLKGATQVQLSKACNISRLSVHRFFNGKTELKATDFVCLLRTLGIDLEEIIDRQLENGMYESDQSQNLPLYSDLATIINKMDGQVKKTLLEQILWWAKSHNSTRQSGLATHRVEQYLAQAGA